MNDDLLWPPPFAHLPGQTPRHDPQYFEQFCEDVINADEPWESLRFYYAMRAMKEGYFWEAHELLEPIWLAARANSWQKLFLQALIQRANAALKSKQGQARASERLDKIALKLLDEARRRAARDMHHNTKITHLLNENLFNLQ